MRTTKIILLLVCLFQAILTSSFAWGNAGHEAIAESAMVMLKGTPVEAKINAILNAESVSNVAIWLDQVREHVQFDDPTMQQEADAFNEQFPHNSSWHFTDYPVGLKTYDPDGKYSSPDDVVHALETAIGVLEGAPSKMTKLQALRLVFHLVGDIHQPMHCVTGYYDISDMNHPKLLADVADPATAPEDRGGNQLYYKPRQELHALWDAGLPNLIGQSIHELVSVIVSPDFESQHSTQGDYHRWPELWASDTMAQGSEAYKGITFDSAAIVKNPHHFGQTMLKIQITLPGGIENYKNDQAIRAKAQLQKAALHLAQLLSQINFQ